MNYSNPITERLPEHVDEFILVRLQNDGKSLLSEQYSIYDKASHGYILIENDDEYELTMRCLVEAGVTIANHDWIDTSEFVKERNAILDSDLPIEQKNILLEEFKRKHGLLDPE